jgi:hypothetical protein
VAEVGNGLGMEYYKRYGKDALKLIDHIRQDESVREYTLADPARFLDFLHLIKNRKGLDIYEPKHFDIETLVAKRSHSVEIGKADYSSNELVEQVYTPLRKEATSWLDPATPTYTVGTWSNLDAEKPYLLRLVPADIAQIFNQAKALYSKVSSLSLTLTGAYDKAIITARDKLNLTQARLGTGQMMFRVMFGSLYLGGVWMGKLWASGMTLQQYANEFATTNYPGTEWKLDLQIDGLTVGDHDTALRFAEIAESYLSQDSKAVEIREKYGELKSLGVKARHRIDEELDKLVRLKA